MAPGSIKSDASTFIELTKRRYNMGRSILLWLIGVPIPIIILIALISR
jgi:hypothetical protein